MRFEDLPELERAANRFDLTGSPRSRVLPSLWQAVKLRDITCPVPDRTAQFPSAESGFRLSADIYLPRGKIPASGWPTALVVYGGAFLFGQKDCHHVRNVVNALGARGIAVLAVEYRKIPQTHFTTWISGALRKWQEGNLRHAVDDVARAVDWYSGNARATGMDPDRLALMGFSAGAMLAALASAHRPERVKGLVGFYGPYEPSLFSGVLGAALRFGMYGTRFSSEEKAFYQPLAMPFPGPAFLIHGDRDGLTRIEHTYKLAADRVRRGLKTYLHVERGAAHGFMNDPARGSPSVSRNLEAVGDFLLDTLSQG